MRHVLLPVMAGLMVGVIALAAVGVQAQRPSQPADHPDETLKRLRLADGHLRVSLWAAEPLLANPVAFAFDERGRVFVAETTRFGRGVPDTRSHMYWLDDDLANRTIDDLLAMYKRHKYGGYEKYSDQLRLVWDSSGAGRADRSTVFSGNYNRPQDGLAAGVLARRGDVYFACIPDLYLLRDTDGDGIADVKQSLFTGFGPTVQFLGHDLHGLRIGPDGRLYFSVGDRGFNVLTREKRRLLYPNTGAVLRCELDGSRLEVVHWGLRNPQELAFDDYGHLFTFDNNSDSGDRARWVYVMEGGDSGWRGGYQYGTLYHTPDTPQGNRGPWNVEKLWHTPHPNQPAWIVPPVSLLGNGPAGITHYPGLGLPDRYRDHFFACDFTADPNSSLIWAVSFRPKGAGFEMVRAEPFIRGIVPTDCDFGPDGGFYWSDWVGGWNPPHKGRIFRVVDPDAMPDKAMAEARRLLAGDWQRLGVDELVRLLGHPHQQVRLEAQFELVRLQVDTRLVEAARNGPSRLARLHAIWGMGMLARRQPRFIAGPNGAQRNLSRDLIENQLEQLLQDDDPEVRRVAAEQLGQVVERGSLTVGGRGLRGAPREVSLHKRLLRLFQDPDLRVRAAAAIAYGKIGPAQVVHVRPSSDVAYLAPLLELLQSNNDADPFLRHAAVMGIVYALPNPIDLRNAWRTLGELAEGRALQQHAAVRRGVLLALRKQGGEPAAHAMVEFLEDRDPSLVAEAARAVYDDRHLAAFPALARLAERPGLSDAVAYRALAANYVLGTPEAARRLAQAAARREEPDHRRVFALQLLADWPKPPRRDPITGLTLELPPREAAPAAAALQAVGVDIFAGSDAVRRQAAQTVTRLDARQLAPALATIVRDPQQPPSLRAEALYALEALNDPHLAELAQQSLTATDGRLRAAARAVLARRNPQQMLPQLAAVLDEPRAETVEKQEALALLGRWPAPAAAADQLLATWLDRLIADQVPPELILDILEAAEHRAQASKKLAAPIRQKLEQYRQTLAKPSDPLAAWRYALHGGDAARGRDIVLHNPAVYCQRCHQIGGQGGAVGPPLDGLAADPAKDRRYLLESIVLPNARIAKGYETVILLLQDERTISGVIKNEDEQTIRLVTPENQEIVVRKADIESRRSGPSAMPADLHTKLTRRQLRDVVEFLASLKSPPPGK